MIFDQVLTTMFLGVSGDLPTTSYVKMVEIWLLFSLMVPFISVLLHIYIDNLRVSLLKNCFQQSLFCPAFISG